MARIIRIYIIRKEEAFNAHLVTPKKVIQKQFYNLKVGIRCLDEVLFILFTQHY